MKSTPCPFCDFDDPPVTVHADPLVQAFISRDPINRHHVLIVPRVHYERFAEVPAPTMAAAINAAQRISEAIARTARPDAITLMTDDDLTGAGFNLVAHWKLHLIPRFRGDAVVIEWNRAPDPGPDARATYARTLREGLASP